MNAGQDRPGFCECWAWIAAGRAIRRAAASLRTLPADPSLRPPNAENSPENHLEGPKLEGVHTFKQISQKRFFSLSVKIPTRVNVFTHYYPVISLSVNTLLFI